MTKRETISKQMKQFLQKTFISSVITGVDTQLDYSSKAKTIIAQVSEIATSIKTDKPEVHKSLLQQAFNQKDKELALIAELKNIFTAGHFNHFDEFIQQTNTWSKDFPVVLKEYQEAINFKRYEEDGVLIKLLKFCKRTGFAFYKFPQVFANLFRWIRKKEKKPLHYWRHTIPERNLHTWYFQLVLVEKLIDYVDRINRHQIAELNKVVLLSDESDYEVLDGFIDDELPENSEAPSDDSRPDTEKEEKLVNVSLDPEVIATDLQDIITGLIEQYSHDRLRVGTWALPGRKFSAARLEKKSRSVKSKIDSFSRNWLNANQLILEDWELNLDLYQAIYSDLITWSEIKIAIAKDQEDIKATLNSMADYLASIKKGIPRKSSKKSELRSYLVEKRYETRKKLSKNEFGELSEQVVAQNYTGIISRIEVSIHDIIEDLPSECRVFKEPIVRSAVADKDITTIAPSELIYFESYNDLEKSFKESKIELLRQTETIRASIEAIRDIIDVSLNAALEVEADDTKSDKDVLEVFDTSMDRAILKVKEIAETIDENADSFTNFIENTLRTFNGKIVALTNNEKVIDLRIRLTKAKAVVKTGVIRTLIITRVIDGFKFASGKVSHVYKNTASYISNITARFARKITKVSLSTKVSDFLAESENRIQKLPFIYRRLFGSQPIGSTSSYTGRDEEISQLNKAFLNWENGKYAATIVLGEKGSGISALISEFLDNLNKPYKVSLIEAPQRTATEESLFSLLGSSLNNKDLTTADMVIEYLNSFEKKRIIVLQDLQHFFLRKVYGLGALQALERIISSTNDNIYWLVNTTKYTWDYLDNTIQIGDFFEYQIELSEMTTEQITEIITSRNKVSGYNIEFTIPEQDLKQKKIRRLSERERQDVYRDKFFSSLNKFTRSNISISLLYWQLSIERFDDDTIYMRPFQAPDLSFISYLDKTKAFILLAAVLHNGITEGELSEILGLSLSDTRLQLLALFEDGIIMKRGDIFVVNPLIYRQVINHLKSINLIY